MSWLSSIGSAISSGFSAVCSGIGSACSAIGRGVSSFCSTVLPAIGNLAVDAIRGIGNTVGDIARALGIFKPDEKPEDVGDRALHAADDGIQPESFDKFDEYMDAIRNFDIDPVKSQKFTPEQKSVAGMAIAVRGMEGKYKLPVGALNELPILVSRDPEYFSADRMTSILATTRDIPTIIEYFDNKLGRTDKTTVESVLVQAEQSRNPEKSFEDIKNEINAVVASVASKINPV